MSRKASASAETAIIRRYKQGFTAGQIARSVGSSSTHVINVLARNGSRPKGTRQRKIVQPNALSHILALRSEGKTLQEIGDEFGVSRERIRQIIRENPAKKKTVMKALRAKGIRREDIARLLGVRADVISRVAEGIERTQRVRQVIAGILDKEISEIWEDALAPSEDATKLNRQVERLSLQLANISKKYLQLKTLSGASTLVPCNEPKGKARLFLKALLINKGITQAEIARRAGVNRSTVSSFLCGHNNGLLVAKALADVLSLTVADCIAGKTECT